jgi:hypothetical protein
MVSVTINAEDPRTIRAIEIAAEADYWLSGRNRAGHEVFGVPSQREPGRYYIVTESSCDCADFQQRGDMPCKHMLAVRLHTELVRAQQALPRERGHLKLIS